MKISDIKLLVDHLWPSYVLVSPVTKTMKTVDVQSGDISDGFLGKIYGGYQNQGLIDRIWNVLHSRASGTSGPTM